MKILTVIGARPQHIKAAMVSKAFTRANKEAGKNIFLEALVQTDQHLDQAVNRAFLEQLGLPRPVLTLKLGGGSQAQMAGRLMMTLEDTIIERKPDLVLVYGDTNSTMAGALAAAKVHVPVAHVGAGLRSFNRRMPEEVNRVLTDHVADWLFCPTQAAVKNLANEGITEGVHNVGDVMYDAALAFGQSALQGSSILDTLGLREKNFFLATIHRQTNTDDPARLGKIVTALKELATNDAQVVWPAHPRLSQWLSGTVQGLSKLTIIEPVSFLDMVRLEMAAKAILTDSGGVQKEAYFHNTPCVTLREEAEWAATVDADWNCPIGADPALIADQVRRAKPAPTADEYGQGQAAAKIASILAAK